MKHFPLFSIFFILCIEILPLLVVRKIRVPERAKIVRFFSALTVVSIFLVLLGVFPHSMGILQQVMVIFCLIAFYGTFPFSRNFVDAIHCMPKMFIAFHLVLINAAPWFLVHPIAWYGEAIGFLKAFLFIHIIVAIVRIIYIKIVNIKIHNAIQLLNGLLPGFFCGGQKWPFCVIVASELFLLMLLRKENE